MRKTLFVILVLTSALSRTSHAQAPADTLVRTLDRVFDAFRGNERPGCAVGVSRNGQVVLERGYGMANLETGTPIQPSSIFHVASVSKQFTAAAIMLLARDGKLSIDDDIRKYVPEMPDYGSPITLRHLLNHTSGLRDQWELLALSRGRFEENRITEADVMDIVPRQKALNFATGTEYLYSNTGYTLLAVVVKRVSGKSLRDFADEKIFKPLGMTKTHFHDDYTMLVPGRTSAYSPVASGWRVSIPNFDVYGATSLFTTVGDLLKWEANFDNPVVGDRNLIDQMQTRARLSAGDTISYGLGIVMDRYRGVRHISHNGADAGYRSYAGRFPDQGLAIAIACNAATANTTALAQGVASAYLAGDLAAVVPPVVPEAVPVSNDVLQRRVGAYFEPGTVQILELMIRDGKLGVGRTGPILIPLADNRFRVPTAPIEYVFSESDPSRVEQRSLSGARSLFFEKQATGTRPLMSYAGEYYSDELDARYRVAVADSVITFRTGTSAPIRARPVFGETFYTGSYTVQFVRSGTEITGFEISNPRMRRVRFSRVSAKR